MVVVGFFGLVGLVATMLLPKRESSPGVEAASSAAEQPG